MDSESLIKPSAGNIICGFFSIIFLLILFGFPHQSINSRADIVLKGSRPYKQIALKDSFEDPLPNLKPHKSEHVYHDIIIEAAIKHDIDPALIKAIIMAESSYDPLAISKKGAIGLMQIMPITATDLGIDDDLFDPERNVNAGVRYLKKLLGQFEGDISLALAAYNAGSRNVKKFQGIPPYKSTQYYIKKVFEYYRFYQGSEV